MNEGDDGKKRCFGNKPGQEFYAKYHDNEWGIPIFDDQRLFEMLVLEGAQAGLSWETILKKRLRYKHVFHDFDVHQVSLMSDDDLEELRKDAGIVRHRLKIYSVRKNANIFMAIQKEYGSFSRYLWGFVDYKPIINDWKSYKELPSRTALSDFLSQDLKKRGMSFVGSTIIYAYMQAVGLVNDHLQGCWCYEKNRKNSPFFKS